MAGADGLLLPTGGVSGPVLGRDTVPAWLAATTRAGREDTGGGLVLLDGAGVELGRLTSAGRP